jgi:hypothetical protein
MLKQKEYLKENPNATLAEYIAYVDSTIEQEKLEEQKRKDKENDYFNSLIGRCFKIQFHKDSIAYFKVMKGETNKPIKMDLYAEHFLKVYHSNTNFDVSIEEHSWINPEWLNNLIEISAETYTGVYQKFQTVKQYLSFEN